MLEKIEKFVNPVRDLARAYASGGSLGRAVSNGIKIHISEILLALFVVLLSLAAFGGGYLFAREQFKGEIRIEENYGRDQ